MDQNETRRKMRDLLWSWGRALDRRESLQRELKRVGAMIEDLYASYPGMRYGEIKGSGGTGDPTYRAVERIDELLEAHKAEADTLQAEILENIRFKRAIDESMNDLSAIERRIIEMRYQNEWSWAYVAIKVNYAESTVREIETGVIDKFGVFWRFDDVVCFHREPGSYARPPMDRN